MRRFRASKQGSGSTGISLSEIVIAIALVGIIFVSLVEVLILGHFTILQHYCPIKIHKKTSCSFSGKTLCNVVSLRDNKSTRWILSNSAVVITLEKSSNERPYFV